jgi:hypothetical protein
VTEISRLEACATGAGVGSQLQCVLVLTFLRLIKPRKLCAGTAS